MNTLRFCSSVGVFPDEASHLLHNLSKTFFQFQVNVELQRRGSSLNTSLSQFLSIGRQRRSINSVKNSKDSEFICNELPNSEVTVSETANRSDSALDAESNESPHSHSVLFTSASNTSNPGVLSHAPFLEQSCDNKPSSPLKKEETYKDHNAKRVQFYSLLSEHFPNLKRRSRLQLLRDTIGSCSFWINTVQTKQSAAKELLNLLDS